MKFMQKNGILGLTTKPFGALQWYMRTCVHALVNTSGRFSVKIIAVLATLFVSASYVSATHGYNKCELVELSNKIITDDNFVPSSDDLCTSDFSGTQSLYELYCRAYKQRVTGKVINSKAQHIFSNGPLGRQVSLALSTAELRLNYIKAVACNKSAKAQQLQNMLNRINSPYLDASGDVPTAGNEISTHPPFSGFTNSETSPVKSEEEAKESFKALLKFYVEYDTRDLKLMLNPYLESLRKVSVRGYGVGSGAFELPDTTVTRVITAGGEYERREEELIGGARQKQYNKIIKALDAVDRMEDALAESSLARVHMGSFSEQFKIMQALNRTRSELVLAADKFNTQFYEVVNIMRFGFVAGRR